MPPSDPLWIDAGLDEAIGTATIDAGTDELTITSHGLADGDLVTFTNPTGGGTALEVGGVYHIVNAAADTFQVSTFQGGPPLDFTSNGDANVFRYRPAYNARALRRAISGMLQIGRTTGVDPIHSHPFGAREGILVPAAAVVGVSGTNWTTTDVVAVVYPAITSQSGAYLVAHPGETGALDPADGTQDRIDALDLQVQDEFEDSSGFRHAHIVYVAGTPGSGTRGAATPNSLELGRVTVFSGGSPAPSPSTTAPLTVARGGVIPVRDTGEYPVANRYQGMVLWDRDNNQLVADTTGQGNWLTIASSQGYQFGGRVYYTADGTFVKGDFPGLRAIEVEMVGGGGGSGGTQATGSGEASEAAGGGGGEYARGFIDDLSQLGASETVTVGDGGAAGSSGLNPGGQGGTSSFTLTTGTDITAVGGLGGQGGPTTSSNTSSDSGDGGSGGTGGDIHIQGGFGGNGAVYQGSSTPTGESSKQNYGGGSQLSGAGVITSSFGSAGASGKLYGGGAAGPRNNDNDPAQGGQPGADGIVIVTLYF